MRNRRSHPSQQSDQRATVWWAKTTGLVTTNPATPVERLRRSSDGFHTWTDEEIAQFENRHPVGTKARLAFALLRYTGVRRSDVVKLGKGMEKDGDLIFAVTKGAERKGRPGETGLGPKRLSLPILLPLRAALDATPSGHLTYLVTEWGKPFTAPGFGNKFRDWCNEAGLPHCSAHGIRKYDATFAAENGATEHQLMAMFGWDSPKQLRSTHARRIARSLPTARCICSREKRKRLLASATVQRVGREWADADKRGSYGDRAREEMATRRDTRFPQLSLLRTPKAQQA